MANNEKINRYRNCYRKLLRLHSKSYFQKFGEGMEQTFSDLLGERVAEGKGVFGRATWLFAETTAGIVRENVSFILMRYKYIVRTALVVACLLMVPLLGGADWDRFDYVVAGGLLFGTGLGFQLIASRVGTMAYKFAVALGLFAVLALIWVNLAVGMIGSEDNPANLLYGGVLAVGLIGTVLARLQPEGMSRTLFAMAATHFMVPVVAFTIFRPPMSKGVILVFVLNTVFSLLFVGSGFLFKRAIKGVGANLKSRI